MTPGDTWSYFGSGFINFIRFLSILFDFDCENRYDRDFVASTLTFWRRLAPECKSEHYFFAIMCVFTVKITPGDAYLPRLYLGSTSALPRLWDRSGEAPGSPSGEIIAIKNLGCRRRCAELAGTRFHWPKWKSYLPRY